MGYAQLNKAMLACGVAALALLPSRAWAQESADPEGQPVQSTGAQQERAASEGSEAIVVTAQRREERLVDVPESVSVLSADNLTEQGIVQFRDYAATVPGLSFYTLGAGYTQISLRGVTVGQDISSTVGIYLDDVPYGSSTAFAGGAFTALDVNLLDVDRIEVLRGPQGTLYGASTIGGLIRYTSRRPDPSAFGVRMHAGLSFTEHGAASYDGSVAANVPIVSDQAAMIVSAFVSHDGGYVDNQFLGDRDVNSADMIGGRVDFLYAPTDQFSVRLVGYAQDIDRDGMSQVDYNYAGHPVIGELSQRRLRPEPFENQFRLASGTLNYNFGLATVTSITSYQTTRPHIVADGSAIYVPTLLARGRTYSAVTVDATYDSSKFTQELRLVSDAAKPLSWILGGFYTRENSEVTTILQAYDPSGAPRPQDEVSRNILSSRYKEYSVFGDLTWRLSDRFDITGGLRYARYEQQFSQTGVGLLGASTPFRETKNDVTTYLLDARYHVSERSTIYARYATGYRPGGINFVRVDLVTGLPVTAEDYFSDDLASYELGAKFDSADGRFGIEAAGYWIDWNDIQLVGRRNGVAVRTNSLSGATILGAELALRARPVRGLELAAALNYQHATLDEANPDLNAVKGERLPNSPDFTANLSASYTFADSPRRPMFGASYQYVSARTSGYEAGTGARAQYHLPGYSIVDLRAGLTLGSFDVQFYLRNLFDARAQLSAYTVYGSPLVTIAQPRTAGVAVRAHF